MQRRNEFLLMQMVERLRQIRKERGLSQDDVFIDTDIHIARIESEKRNISVSTLSDLCDYFGISLKEFFEGINTDK